MRIQQRFHHASQWWFSLTMPPHQEATTLAERERLRKARMLSIVFAFVASFGTLLVLQYTLERSPLANVSFVYTGMLGISIWLNRKGRPEIAAFFYLMGYVLVLSWGLWIDVPHASVEYFWKWSLFQASPMLVSMFLPFWTPMLFALTEFLMIAGVFYIKQPAGADGHVLALPLQLDFLLYVFISLFTTAFISAIHAHGTEKAIRESDRAVELELAHAALAQANTRLEHLADHDTLTGLLNRRAFLTRLEAAAAPPAASAPALAVIFADLDHFKSINDTWGHHIGDQALCHLAKHLTMHVPAQSITARYGGEEFVIARLGCDEDEIYALAEQIRCAIAASPLVLADEQHIHLTISMGVAVTSETMPTIDAVLAAADSAMYTAKRSGRNRVCSAATTALAPAA